MSETEVHPIVPWLTAPRRRWLYGVITAAQPLLAVIGITTESTAPLWVAVALAVVGTGTATAHTAQTQ